MRNVIIALFTGLLACYVDAGMDDFLRNSLYTIHSIKDDGVLSLTDTPHSTYKRVTVEKWKNMEAQKWIVEDFQSLGLYHFTPLIHNTTNNMVTYHFTKNAYTYKRQWKVNMIRVQRYQVQNPESGLCLVNMGMHQQVEEADCDKSYPMAQVWKFRMLKK